MTISAGIFLKKRSWTGSHSFHVAEVFVSLLYAGMERCILQLKKPEAETICFRLEIRVNQLVLPGKLPPWEGWVGVVEFSEEELLDVSCRTPVSVTSTSIV